MVHKLPLPKRFASGALSLGLASSLLSAAPVSQPAAAIPKDWQNQDHSAQHLSFSTPPQWKPGSSTEETFYFLLPTQTRMDSDKVCVAIHPVNNQTLSQLVDKAKQDIKSDTGSKVLKDAADKLDGQPAWVLLSDKEYTNAAAEPAKAAGNAAKTALKPATPTRHLRTFQEICIVDDKALSLAFTSDAATYDQQFANFKKMLATVKVQDPASDSVAASTANEAASSTTLPIANLADSNNWMTVSRPDARCDLSVPATWKKVKDDSSELRFTIPKQGDQPIGDDLHLSFGGCHPVPLRELAPMYRADIVNDPSKKLETDELISLAGRPAWLFVASDVYVLSDGRKRDSKLYRVLTIDSDFQILMTFNMDHTTVNRDLAVMKQIMEKFKWTAPPRDPALATTQPS